MLALYRSSQAVARSLGVGLVALAALCIITSSRARIDVQLPAPSVAEMTGLPSMSPSASSYWPEALCLMEGQISSFCLAVNTEFEEFLQSCEWKTVDHREVFSYVSAFKNVVNGSQMYGQGAYDHPLTDVQLAAMPVIRTCSDDSWTAFSVGPFHTTGGELWESWEGIFNASSPLMPPKPDGWHTHYAFSDYFLGSIDGSNQLVGMPPIHQHHFHFGYASEWLMADVGSFNTQEWYKQQRRLGLPEGGPTEAIGHHGDDVCHTRFGGIKCTIRSTPEGYVYAPQQPLGAMNTIVDSRRAGSPALASWQVIAVKSPKVVRNARALFISYLPSFRPSDGIYSPRITFTIDSTLPCVAWMMTEFYSEHVIEATMHAHAEHTIDLWWFQGEPHEVFDDMSIAATADTRVLCAKDSVTLAMQNIRKRQERAGAAKLTCSYRTHAMEEIINVDGMAQTFVRKVRCPIKFHSSAHTVIGFFQSPAHYRFQKARVHAMVRVKSGFPMDFETDLS